jgi:hypothetical protein
VELYRGLMAPRRAEDETTVAAPGPPGERV